MANRMVNKKAFTKKRIVMYLFILLLLGGAIYKMMRDEPDMIESSDVIWKYLKDNPETTSLYVAQDGEELITYQSDVVRPLASVVKIVVALEYAMQIEEGKIDQNMVVQLDELSRYYVEGTDGGAHEAWVSNLEPNKEVTLHEAAKGMILYSSNANTDFLIDLLGANAINNRLKNIGIIQHEEIYPIVGALFISNYIKKEHTEEQLIEELTNMPIDSYRALAMELSGKLKDGTIQSNDIGDISLDVQRVWSDRLTGSSASEYGKLLSTISRDEFSPVVTEVLRDLLEWPMELHESNRELFAHFGAKGGSTAFVLNQAMYVENKDGQKVELVIMIDDLSMEDGTLVYENFDSFIFSMLTNEEYREKVSKDLYES
ncbi:serine hydrolase [Psychrobacillus sp.]|uniref:serine hydrolase n=1 Tax=Psychrobacillus sp. TaxID=1871623 RepID=UPI0028BD4FB7|nr:serine hydrolase [Psychrobacillus sp.]